MVGMTPDRERQDHHPRREVPDLRDDDPARLLGVVQVGVGETGIPPLGELSNPLDWLPLMQRDLGGLSTAARFRKALARVDELIYAEIADRRAALAANGDGAREDVLSRIDPAYWFGYIGVLLIAVVMFAQGGILGLLDRVLAALRRRS